MDNNQQRNNQPGGGGQGGPKKNHSTVMIFLIVTLVTLIVMGVFNNMVSDTTRQEITYNQFLEMLEKDQIQSVRITSNEIEITLKSKYSFGQNSVTYYTGLMSDPYLVERLNAAGVSFKKDIPDTTSNLILNILLSFAPLILIWILMGFLFRKMSKGGGMMGVGKSKAKVYVQKETGITFKDVAGQDEAKESLQEVVDFLENPEKYTDDRRKAAEGCAACGPSRNR